LVRDLRDAQESVMAGARLSAGDQLLHAQAIIFELLSALDFSVGPISEQLGQLYVWMVPQLVQANLEQDATKVAHVRSLVEPLAEAWHLAAAESARTGGMMGTAV